LKRSNFAKTLFKRVFSFLTLQIGWMFCI